MCVDGGRVVSMSGLETSVSSSTTTNAIIYDAYTSTIKKIAEKNSDEDVQKLKCNVSVLNTDKK